MLNINQGELTLEFTDEGNLKFEVEDERPFIIHEDFIMDFGDELHEMMMDEFPNGVIYLEDMYEEGKNHSIEKLHGRYFFDEVVLSDEDLSKILEFIGWFPLD